MEIKCRLRKKMGSMCSASNLTKVNIVPTRAELNAAGVRTDTYINHTVFILMLYSNILTVPVRSSNHLMAVRRELKTEKAV